MRSRRATPEAPPPPPRCLSLPPRRPAPPGTGAGQSRPEKQGCSLGSVGRSAAGRPGSPGAAHALPEKQGSSPSAVEFAATAARSRKSESTATAGAAPSLPAAAARRSHALTSSASISWCSRRSWCTSPRTCGAAPYVYHRDLEGGQKNRETTSLLTSWVTVSRCICQTRRKVYPLCATPCYSDPST